MTTGKITILDGGLGRELEKRGAPFKQPEWSALALMEAPEVVSDVHRAFIASGASVITTNSYALVPFHIGEKRFKEQGSALAISAGEMARAAADGVPKSIRVAGSLPPLFGSYRPDLYRPERVGEIASPLIEGLNSYVDLWLCETQSSIDESLRVKSLVDSLDAANKPFWVAFTLDDSQVHDEPLLRSGESVVDAVKAMVDAGVDAILFNCCQPEVISEAIQTTQHQLELLDATNIEIGAYANAFPSQPKDATANLVLNEVRADLSPLSYLDCARQWIEDGATLIGGCCGIGPEHIAVLAEQL